MLIIPALVLFAAVNMVHYGLASVLTVIASPMVAVVHIVSQLSGGNALKNQAGKLQGITSQEYITRTITDDTLNSFLNVTGHSYSDIIMDLKKVNNKNEYLPALFVMENHNKYMCCIDGNCEHQKGRIQFKVELKNLSEDDKVAINALIKLNAGSLRDNLKAHNSLQEIEQLIGPST